MIPLIPAWIAAASLLVTMMAVVPESRIAREVLSGTEKRCGEAEEVEFVVAVSAVVAAVSAVAAVVVSFFPAPAAAAPASTSVPFPPWCLIPSS